MVLDGLALLDEGILGRGEAALEGGAEDGVVGGTQLGRQSRHRADELSLKHHFLMSIVVGGEMVLVVRYS